MFLYESRHTRGRVTVFPDEETIVQMMMIRVGTGNMQLNSESEPR
jgi:hypothetical protein